MLCGTVKRMDQLKGMESGRPAAIVGRNAKLVDARVGIKSNYQSSLDEMGFLPNGSHAIS